MAKSKNEKIESTGEKCKACGGEIVKRFHYEAITRMPRYGNPNDWGWVLKSKFCKKCKIKYE